MHLSFKHSGLLNMRFLFGVLFLFFNLLIYSQSTLEIVDEALKKNQFKKIERHFNDQLSKEIEIETLIDAWKKIELVHGEYQGMSDIETKYIDGSTKTVALLEFKTAVYNLILKLDEEDKIDKIGIWMLDYTQPEYAIKTPYGKKYLSVKSDTFSLPGELILPTDCNHCPVVVMVHGSHPQDKDESIGPNKVFYDLAMGLAAKGIASFRYDKRSFTYPDNFVDQFDIYEETVNDAVAAILMLQREKNSEIGNIYVLGHSLGGYALPMILDSVKEVKGAIFFAAPARNLEDLINEQTKYLCSLDSAINKQESKLIKLIEERVQIIKTHQYDSTTIADDLLVYWPGKFWNSVEDYDLFAQTRQINIPVLIMQGAKDYQVTTVDYNLWKHYFKANDKADFLLYPDLNHIFQQCRSSQSSPIDYYMSGNVNEEVVTDLAEWVLKCD